MIDGLVGQSSFLGGGALGQGLDQIYVHISQEKVYLHINELGAIEFKSFINYKVYIDPRLQILP